MCCGIVLFTAAFMKLLLKMAFSFCPIQDQESSFPRVLSVQRLSPRWCFLDGKNESQLAPMTLQENGRLYISLYAYPEINSILFRSICSHAFAEYYFKNKSFNQIQNLKDFIYGYLLKIRGLCVIDNKHGEGIYIGFILISSLLQHKDVFISISGGPVLMT